MTKKQVSFPWLVAPKKRRRTSTRSLAARMAPAAVRIPDPRLTQLPLQFVALGPQIFVHEGARQALERRIDAAWRGPVQLAVTDNRRRMVTFSRTKGVLRVRVHMMFLGAPDRVLDALVRYIVDEDRASSQMLGAYIHANSHRIRASRPVFGPLNTEGRVHDLLSVLSDVNERYFGSAVTDVLITWGRKTQPRERKRTSIKLGSYSATERLIRVHPCLDAEWVPRYFLSYIVYHELLHHLVPAFPENGRTELHSAEFRRRERDFRHYERAIEWERKHIDRLLRSK